MSNLGMYQAMTTIAKKVGGPVKFIGLVAASGYATGKLLETGVKKVRKKISEKSMDEVKGKTFTVTSSGADEQGLTFNVGDEYRVMERDGNAIQIEKIGDSNNPYFVSAEFLRSISDFPKS